MQTQYMQQGYYPYAYATTSTQQAPGKNFFLLQFLIICEILWIVNGWTKLLLLFEFETCFTQSAIECCNQMLPGVFRDQWYRQRVLLQLMGLLVLRLCTVPQCHSTRLNEAIENAYWRQSNAVVRKQWAHKGRRNLILLEAREENERRRFLMLMLIMLLRLMNST